MPVTLNRKIHTVSRCLQREGRAWQHKGQSQVLGQKWHFLLVQSPRSVGGPGVPAVIGTAASSGTA